MSHIVGYCGLFLLEAVSVGASVSGRTGEAATAAFIIGLLAAIPTANHCAGRLFNLLTRGIEYEQAA